MATSQVYNPHRLTVQESLNQHLGKVIRVSPTLDTSAYADNDVFFNATEIPNAVPKKGGTSRLIAITMLNEDYADHNFDLVFMQVASNLGTINDAVGSGSLWTNALAKAAKPLGYIAIDMSDNDTDLVNNLLYHGASGAGVTTNSAAASLPMLLQAESGSTSVYFAAVSRSGTPTCAVDDYEFAFHIEYR